MPSLEFHTEKEDDAIFAASASWNGTIISSSQAKRALLFWFFKWWWNSSHRRPSKKKTTTPPAFFLQWRARHILCGTTDDGRFCNSRYEWLGKYARNFECCHYKWQQRSHPALFQILATSWFFKVMMYVRGGPPSANTSRNCSSLEAMSGSFFKVGAKKLFGSVETTWSLKSVRTVAPLPLLYFKRRLRSYCWKNIFFETQKRDWNLLRSWRRDSCRRTNLLLFAWSSV